MSKKYDTAVGLPLCQEVDSIKNVTEKVDEELGKYFPNHRAVIINADNNSSDGTQEIFWQTSTRNDRIVIKNKEKSKGINLIKIFQRAFEIGAKAVMIADTDVASIRTDWVKLLVDPAAPKLFNMFFEVTITPFDMLRNNKNYWQKDLTMKSINVLNEEISKDVGELKADVEVIKKMTEETFAQEKASSIASRLCFS